MKSVNVSILVFSTLLSAIVAAQEPAGPPGRFGGAVDLVAMPLRARSLPAYQQLPLTVEMWVRLPEDKKSRYHVLLSNLPGSPRGQWEIYTTPSDGRLTVSMSDVQPSLLRSFVRITDGRWHHVTVTCDGKQLAAYVDGQPAGAQSVEPVATGPPGEGELFVGPELDREAGVRLAALIDELRISNNRRTVRGLPEAPLAVDEHTVGLWRFDETSGNRRQDESTRANALTFSPGIEAAWTPRSSTRADAEPWERETDADWLDDRFNDMDKGAFLGLSMSASGTFGRGGEPYAAKGLAMRLGADQQVTALFDRGLLQLAAAWAGGFLHIPDARFGLIQHPQPVGRAAFGWTSEPGWERPEGVKSERPPRWSVLPGTWGRYQGLYRYGSRTILCYTVGQTRVLDMPWAVAVRGKPAVTRTLRVDPAIGPLVLRVCRAARLRLASPRLARAEQGDGVFFVALAAGSAGELRAGDDGVVTLVIPARQEPVEATLVLWRGKRTDDDAALAVAEIESFDLAQATSGGPTRWPERIETEGELAADQGAPLVVDTLTLPDENPYGSIFYVTGVGPLPDGRIAICTIYGDVWLVDGVDEDLQKLTWKRFAAGMYQPLGLAIKNGRIHVLERGQITCLHDLNGDDEADFYENVYHGWETTGAGHAYDTALKLAPDGSFFFFKGQVSGNEPSRESGSLVRVFPDASGHEVYATGFRHPIGLGMGPDGTVTGADQQGNWMPATRIDRYRRGGFYGDMRTHHRETPPATYDQPLCWLPHHVDNSAGGQVWVPNGRWGPLGGRLLHLSWGRCLVYLLLEEQVAGQFQGGAVALPCERLLSGPITGVFHPRDGHLYLAGLHGWQTAAVRDGCLQRIRYTGTPFRLPLALRTHRDGVEVRFSQPLARQSAQDLSNYVVEQWNYRYSADYGSDHWSVADPSRMGHDRVPIEQVTVSADGRSLRLRLGPLRPVMQMMIRMQLEFADGTPWSGEIHNTIHAVPGE